MAGNIKGIKIEIDGDTQPLQKALKAINKESVNTTNELKQIDKALKFDTGNVILLTQKQEVLQKQIGITRDKLETLRQAQSKVDEEFKKGNIGSEQYRAFQREVEVTQNVLKGYEGKLASLTQALEGNGDAAKNNQAQLKELQNEQKLLASESEKVVSSFKLQESQMGANASEADKLALAEKKIGAQSEIVTRQIENLEKQLSLTKEQYGENSAEANKMEAELNQAKTAYANLNQELGKLGSTAKSNQTQLKELQNEQSQLASEMSKVTSSFKLQESALGSNASEAERNALAQKKIGAQSEIVSKQISNLEQQLEITKKEFGENSTQANKMESELNQAKTAFNHLNDEMKGTKSAADSTQESLSEISRNLRAELLQQFSEKLSAISEKLVEVGKEALEAAAQMQASNAQFTTVFGDMETQAREALNAIGQPLLEMMIPVFQTLATIVKGVAELFSSLPAPVKDFVVILGTVVTAVGVIAPIFLSLQALAEFLKISIGEMIIAALPIIGTAIAIAAAVAAIVAIVKYLWETNEGFRDAVTTVWNAILEVINAVVSEISNFVMSIFGTVVTWWTENQELIRTSAETVWNAIYTVISTILDILGPLLQAGWDNIQLIITTTWEIIKIVVETAINVVLGVIQAVMQIITGDWSGAWETIKGVFSTVWQAIQSIVQTIFSAIQSYISNILNGISGTVSNIWNSIKDTVSNVLNAISSTVSSVWEGIKSTISSAINGARDAVSSAIEAIKGLFNFNISWPHIPLPHFYVSGSANPLDWLSQGVPSIGIEWYAKGGIMTKPTIFGMNGNNIMVGGEAGNEAVLPLNDKTLGAIGRGIAQTMGGTSPTINITITGNTVREEADISRIADEVAQRIADELQRKTQLRGGFT
ncbi:prophage LambdaSa04, tail tape measure protein, TP901 family [Streptococcus pneumoniae]|nr:prophage LambdaSa04, tail tape measure protein, TP901 family [Streptococcus pneumoniae]